MSSKEALNAALEASGNELSSTDMFERFTLYLAGDQSQQQDTSLTTTEGLQDTGRKGAKKKVQRKST